MALSLRLSVVLALAFTMAAFAQSQPNAGGKRLARLPVQEVTVFKDGHVFVMREGDMPVDARGRVVLDDLPAPVMGTFWPYSAVDGAPLKVVVASARPVLIDPSTLSLRERLELNVGGEAYVREKEGASYFATVVRVSPADGAVAVAAGDDDPARISDAAPVVYLQTAAGVRSVPLDAIEEVSFRQDKAELPREEVRNLLTLGLDWPDAMRPDTARVGMFYLQRGIRWIPSYKIDIDGRGKATVVMQATIVNELTDLDDARVNLVVGVPSFAFKDTPDPMGVQAAVADLSQYFRADARVALSNAIMTQARMGERQHAGAAAAMPDLPELGGADRHEDLYVFNLEHVTLRQGERMVMPIGTFELPYEDVYKLDLPVMPPTEVWRSFNSEQQEQIARDLVGPKVQHVLRLTNTGKAPLTTAPALVLRNGTLLAQGLLAYTPAGAPVDLHVTTAVDVSVKKTERETQRTPDAQVWAGDKYMRVDLAGTIELTNRRQTPVKLEVVRHVVGIVDAVDPAGPPGKAEMVNLIEADDYLAADPWSRRPAWWSWYGWPGWWHRLNGVGRFTWDLTLKPGEKAELKYTWHYLWR